MCIKFSECRCAWSLSNHRYSSGGNHLSKFVFRESSHYKLWLDDTEKTPPCKHTHAMTSQERERFWENCKLVRKPLCCYVTAQGVFYSDGKVHTHIQCENQWMALFFTSVSCKRSNSVFVFVIVIFFISRLFLVPWLVRYSSRVSHCLVARRSDNGFKSCCFPNSSFFDGGVFVSRYVFGHNSLKLDEEYFADGTVPVESWLKYRKSAHSLAFFVEVH